MTRPRLLATHTEMVLLLPMKTAEPLPAVVREVLDAVFEQEDAQRELSEACEPPVGAPEIGDEGYDEYRQSDEWRERSEAEQLVRMKVYAAIARVERAAEAYYDSCFGEQPTPAEPSEVGPHCPDECDHWDAGTECPVEATPAKPSVTVTRERPIVVCLCGSTRFYDEFQKANYDLTMRGEIVLSVGFYPHANAEHGHGEGVGHDSQEKVALDELHKRKIDLADYVFVLNVGGYIGESTLSEIEYARAKGIPVRYLQRFIFQGAPS